MNPISQFLFTTSDRTRTHALPVTLDVVLSKTREQSLALCNFMDPNGDLEDVETWEAGTEGDMLTSFVIFHTLYVAIEVARDTETGVVQEPWTTEGVDAMLDWCVGREHTAWVVREIAADCGYVRGAA